MIVRNSNLDSRRGQRGYALLMVIFLAATVMLLAVTASLTINSQGRRQKEEELAWRGNQYRRAIGLFFKKNGRYPRTMDELTAHHTDQPNFIRKPYKDPMNKADGSWRLIYVLPNGQLQGSVMHTQLQGAMPIAGPLGGAPNGGTTNPGAGGTTGQPTVGGTGTQQPPSTTQPGAPGSGQSSSSTSDSTVFGGSIVGVASKIKTPSIRVYKLGTSYFEWEFIYDITATPFPLPAVPTGTPTGTQPPTTPGQPGTTSGQPQGSGNN